MPCIPACILILTAAPATGAQDVETLRQRILAVHTPSNPAPLAASVDAHMASLADDGS